MGVRERQQAIRAMRGPMRSPGRPPGWRREHRQRFWEAIAGGCRARRRQRWPGWHPRRAPGGSVKVVACRRSVRPRCRGATCPSSSETRSPSCTRSAAGCARDRSQLSVDGAFPVENVPARVAARRTGIRRGWGGIGRCRWVGRVPGHRRQAAGVALREQESVGCAGHCSTNLASRARMSLASATI
jgi:hypothetical protein